MASAYTPKFQSKAYPVSGSPDWSETLSWLTSGSAKKTSSHASPGARKSQGSSLRRRWSDSISSGPGHLRHRLLHLALVAGRERGVGLEVGGDVVGREDELVLG